MSMPLAFSPSPGQTVNIAVSNTSGTVALPTKLPDGYLRLFNAGASTVFVAIGSSTITASATADMPLVTGATIIIDRGNATTLAAITATSTATLYATAGEGGS